MGKFQDLTGVRFGQLVVLSREPSENGATVWACLCDCGQLSDVRAGNLKSGAIRTCGHGQRCSTPEDMTGLRFHRLVVIGYSHSTPAMGPMWECACDCGGQSTVSGKHLRGGNTKSCGCQRVDSAKVTNRKHGRANTPEYKRWESIKQRTTNPKNPSFKNYGGRGITMCPEWFASFEAFLAGVGEQPTPEHQLDRTNNDGNYEPGNVRWASRSEQMLNRRPLRRVKQSELAEALDSIAARDAEIAELRAALRAGR